jgi:Ca-activated chloride channel family protein
LITDYFNNISFSQPWIFFFLLVLPLLIAWYVLKNNSLQGSIAVSDISATGLSGWKNAMRHIPFACRLLAIAALITAMANPRSRSDGQNAEGEGVDIVLCMDISGSMNAQDFTPNRLEAAKSVAVDFVNKRLADRIAVVIFSGESFTQCPLTTDHGVLQQSIKNIRNGLLEDGTAIGSGLGTSVDRLRSSTAKSKVIILLTDGVNNGGLIDPNTAKEIAKRFGVKVYTIGVGTEGYAPVQVKDAFGRIITQQQKVSIDEKLLTQIATETGGKYFRAKDNASLSKIYDDIDALEKSKVEITSYTRYADEFFPFVMIALGFIFLEILLRFTVFKKFP